MSVQTESNRLQSQTNVQGSLNSLLKVVYADKLENIRPEGTYLQKDINFVPRDKQIGEKYVLPIITGYEHGVTYAESLEDAFALNSPIPGSIKSAEVRSNPMVLRSYLGYSAASRAANDAASFESATKFVLANMAESVAYKMEIVLWHGQTNIGVVQLTNLVNENPDGSANTGAVANTILQLTDADWADFVWAGSEGMKITFFSGSSIIGDRTVVEVNMDKRWIQLDTAVSTPVGYTINVYGSRVTGGGYKESMGLAAIMSQTQTLFGIALSGSNSSSLYRPNVVPALGIPSFNKLNSAITKAVAKGLKKKVKVYVPFKAWDILMTDQAALRMFDSSYKSSTATNGMEQIKYYSKNGEIEVVPCGYVKNGQMFIIAPEDFLRIGSSDITFKIPGDTEQFFRHLENNAGYEMRCWSDVALFALKPGHAVMCTGLQYQP